MTSEERRHYWKTLVDEQSQSGLSASNFCLEHNKVSRFVRVRGNHLETFA